MKRVIAFVLVLFQAMPVMAQNAPAQQGQVLNLQDADIRVFIQDVARATGTTFIIDPKVQGKVTVTSQQPLQRT